MFFHGFPVSANVSLLFSDVPYIERFGAAAAAGFDRVESWWPFATPSPAPDEVTRFVEAIEAAGVTLTGLNFWAGDMPGGDRGVAAVAGRAVELRENLPSLLAIARATECRSFNLLYGHVDDDPESARSRAAAAIAAAADEISVIDGTILLEPLAQGLNGAYPLLTPEDVLEVIDGDLGGRDDVKLLFDVFHLASNGVDTPGAASRLVNRIGHVQFADAPGRGEPGSGVAMIDATMEALRGAGYSGTVAAEYKPTRPTAQTLDWGE